MPTIRATCPSDGDVSLTPCDVTLRVCVNVPALSTYAFRCPACGQPVVKRACGDAIRLLADVVKPITWRVPAEALEPHLGPAISYDELLDFALALAHTDHVLGELPTDTHLHITR